MEFEKKVEVQYIDGSKVTHTFSVLSVEQRNKIFGEYLDMRKFMTQKDKDETNPMDFIKEDKNILDFTTAVLKAGCPTLDTNKIPANVSDELFEELNEFIFTGTAKN